MPVAVPLVAAPAALLLAIGAGADLGVAIVVAAALVATAALDGGRRGAPARTGAGRRVALWAGRLLAAAGVAACILLVVDGVYDV